MEMLNNTLSSSGNSSSSSAFNCSCPPETMMMYPSYMMEDDKSPTSISLTTSSPQHQSGVSSSTQPQTTLPPVVVPGVPEVSSLPADLPATIPTPEAKNGVYSCSQSSSGMTTNFINPSYPQYDSEAGSCKFYLILNSNVCQVRVDFVDTDMLAPVEGKCSQQSLTISGSIRPLGVTSFCGKNSDQHFYIETSRTGANSYVEFSVSTQTSSQYKWGLWITQITCDGTRTIQAPTGCFQYYFDTAALIQSYNYDGGQYYTDQHYRMCILTSTAACQISFTTEGAFMLEKWGNFKTNPYTRAGVTPQYCVQDYLQIPGGSSPGGRVTHDRFCGGQLSTSQGARTSEAVVVNVTSPLVTLDLHTGTPAGEYINQHHSPGFRIRYQQLSCI